MESTYGYIISQESYFHIIEIQKRKEEKQMPLSKEIKDAVYSYCNGHLAEDSWYENEFDFVEDNNLRDRIIAEYRGTRFAYKLLEGIEAEEENKLFQVRHQILSYASIYEAIIHYILYEYYNNTKEFHDMKYHITYARIDIPASQKATLSQALLHNGEEIIPFHLQERQIEDAQIRFDSKCRTCEKLNILHDFVDKDGNAVGFVQELIDIYGYRNAIHIIAEQRKGIAYELELSKLAYLRMRPFIDQIKGKLKADKKSIYA